MYNQKIESTGNSKMLDLKIFVVPYTNIPHHRRIGNPIPIEQITERTQINTDFEDAFWHDTGEYRDVTLSIVGSIELFVNGKHILDITQETRDLLSLWYGLDAVTQANLELIRILKGEKEDKDIVFQHSYDEYEIRNHPFSCSWIIPRDDKESLILSYESKFGKGEERLNRNKFSQLLLLESKRFFEKILTLFPEQLAVKEEHYVSYMLPNLENVNFVRGFLLCEELNRQQNPQ
ncbi:MAG: hypothetical protein HC921_21885 [Synechococcaceae cyanobacterium SM2_3_1]|nr:hypothetical protein [Synechococcaceae cyanobacterium SM2_3_1]